MASWLEIHFNLTSNSEFCDTKSLIRCSESFSKKKQISENLDKIFQNTCEGVLFSFFDYSPRRPSSASFNNK